MINIQQLTLQRGRKLLFDSISLTIFAKEKIGFIGINGSGKSSLFAMLLGQLQSDTGELSMPANIQIAHLSQQIPNTDISALQYVINGDQELAKLLQKLTQVEAKKDNVAIAKIHNKLYEIDGYTAPAKAAKLLNGLGFKTSEHQQAVNEFSGGWRMRLNLAQVLMSRADLLLLDEPTNHLDLDAIIWLERWLQQCSGTLVLISHDRDFLDSVVTKIAHIDNHKIDLYSGNYSSFETQRAEQLMLEQKLHTKQQKQIAHMTDFVRRFRAKATKAKQAQSRLKMLQKMQQVAITHVDSPFNFEFLATKQCSPPLLTLNNISFAYSDEKILSNISFSLDPEDRIGILGPNGAGKSTLIKLLSGYVKPSSGDIHLNKNLKIGYFAQHQIDQLNLNKSAFDHIFTINTKIREQQIRDFLGGFDFRGDRIFEPITNFSGGEKARLTLAILVWQQPNLLLLDEPTNHLDLDMREALTLALQSYTGTLVLISHDRHLLKTTVNNFYLVHDQKVTKFNGDLNDYQDWLLANKKSQNKNPQKNSSTNQAQIHRFETKLKRLYIRKEEIEAHLATTTIYQEENKKNLANYLQKLEKIKYDINLLEEQWLSLSMP